MWASYNCFEGYVIKHVQCISIQRVSKSADIEVTVKIFFQTSTKDHLHTDCVAHFSFLSLNSVPDLN